MCAEGGHVVTAERRKQYIGAVALILFLAVFILTVFSLASRTDKVDLYLMDKRSARYGWRYEALVDGSVRAFEPDFSGEYILKTPEGTEAVRITRTMTEDMPEAALEWMCYLDGVDVFLDGELIYSDFPQLERDEDGFVHPDRQAWDKLARLEDGIWRQTSISLPADYPGRELSMITYFQAGSGVTVPEYPFLGNYDTGVAGTVVLSVKNSAVMTIYALMALSMAGMFLLDRRNSGSDGRTLLLCLYFLMLFLDEACNYEVGYYSALLTYLDLRFLRVIYMAPLYLYLALRLTKWWKWPLCGGITAWALYAGVREFLSVRQNEALAVSIGPGALLVFLALAVAFCVEAVQRDGRRPAAEKKRFVRYGLLAVAVTAVYVIDKVRRWDGIDRYLRDGIWQAVSMGNFWPLVSLVTDITSYMTVILVVTEIIRRTVQTRRTMDVLRERSRLTMEGYERMLKAQERTNAANHEMRHHMTALAGLLRAGDTARAAEYAASVTDALDKLPTVRYSANILVDAIAGTYLDQAKAQGVQVEYTLKVPAQMAVADEDLSVFLTNLLENALHACQRVAPKQPRYIRLKMAVHENFLFIGCVNSAPDEQEADGSDAEERLRSQHGYGLEAMRQIAEKYSSMLLIERTEGEFSVRSNFSLRTVKT